MAYDVNKLTKLGHLQTLAENLKAAIPTKVSQLTNDSNYQTNEQVAAAIQAAIAESGHAIFQRVDAVPEAATAQTNILYLVLNEETQHYDIYAKVGEEMELLDDTTVDLSNYVEKEAGKGLSTNDFTTELKDKLDGIEEGANKYTHPAYTAQASGFYKVTVDAAGHVSAVEAVTKDDVTALGIPGENTTYQPAVADGADGLLTGTDKAKLDTVAEGATKVEASQTAGNIKVNGTETPVVIIATDDEVTEMLAEVFPTA